MKELFGNKERRGPGYKRIKKSTVQMHLYPPKDLPEDIRKLLASHFGTALYNEEQGIVEVGGSGGGPYADLWFYYRVVKIRRNSGRQGNAGMIEQPCVFPGWRERLAGLVGVDSAGN